MMILCPSCDTGFKLPDKHITSRGAKLRCSKCSHIFRVRRVEGLVDPEIFYKEEDRLKNDENGTSLDEASDGFGALLKSDEAPSSQTHFGLAGFGAGSSGEIPVSGDLAKPAAAEPEQEDHPDEDEVDDLAGSSTMLGHALKPSSGSEAGGFGGGLDFGDIGDAKPKVKTSFGMTRPTTEPRRKFSGANKGLDLGPLKSPPQTSEPQGTALGAPGIKPRSGRRGDLLDSSLFGDSSSAEESSAPAPMIMVPESDAHEEVSGEDVRVDNEKRGSDLDIGSFGLSDAIDDAMRAREEKKASREKARAARAPKFVAPEPEPEPELRSEPTPARAPLAPLDNESSGVGIDLFGDDEPDDAPFEDPFGGAFGEEEEGNGLDFASLAQAAEDAEPEPEPEPDAPEPILVAGQPGMASRPSPEQRHGGAHGVSVDMPEDTLGDASAGDGGDDFWGQKDSYFGPADSLVDTGYDDSAGFDPNAEVVETGGPAAPEPVTQRPRPAPVEARPEPRPEPRPAAAPPGRARRGSSSVDKAKNALIIGGGVLFGFLAVLVALNDGVVDFKRFGVTLESAFSDKPFTPRPEWVAGAAGDGEAAEGDQDASGDDPAATITRPSDLEVDSASASFLPLQKKSRVVAVRGRVLNRSTDEYVEVRVRVMLLNAKEQIVAEKEVPVGGFVTDALISKEKNPVDAAALTPDTPTKIPSLDGQSFTAIFDEIPKEVTPDGPIYFKVEFTKKVSEADLATDP